MDSKAEYLPRSSIDSITRVVYIPSPKSGWREQRSKVIAWAPITTSWLITAVLLFCLLVKDSNCMSPQEPASFWKRYEFQPLVGGSLASTNIDVFFDSTLKYNESHQIYRPPVEPNYVGTPTPSMDQAWDELIGSINIFLTPEEAATVGEDMYLDPDTNLYMAQVSVFHNLHCLNLIRQRIFIDEYPELQDYTLDVHVEHCIDNLRLSLMCSADMTLMPIEWSVNRNHFMARFETYHTCRDYEGLKAWAKARDSADLDRYMHNAESLHRQMSN